jgi:Effector protein/RTX calcium-binding nonapeptide repeat (4 copies)
MSVSAAAGASRATAQLNADRAERAAAAAQADRPEAPAKAPASDPGAAEGRTLRRLNEDTPRLRAHFTAPRAPAQGQADPAQTGPADLVKQLVAQLAATTKPDSVRQDGNTVVVDTADRRDNVRVTQDAGTGEVTVNVNGVDHRFDRDEAQNIVINTNGGNDVVEVDAGVQANTTVRGGAGNDTITTGAGADRVYGGAGDDTINTGTGNDGIYGGDGDDRVQAGAGDDFVDGGAGNDYADGSTGNDKLLGRSGADTLYGGEGDDRVDGGDGQDYLDGYLGNDTILGGQGNDVVSGGQGDDTLTGNEGNDVIYAGRGVDRVNDEFGTNTVYHQADDKLSVNQATRDNPNTRVLAVADIPDNLVITGSSEFTARMQADLETLAASPAGQASLRNIDAQAGTLTVREFFGNNGRGGSDGPLGTDGFVEVNPAFHLNDDGRVPPIVVLQHELNHAWTAMSNHWDSNIHQDPADPTAADNGIRNFERQAVGLPIDHDGDPSTPMILDPNIPWLMTENAIRDEMGYGRRQDYN